MKENPYDRVQAKIMARIESVTDRIANRYARVNPFGQEPISDRELIEYYRTLSPDDVQYLISRHGEQVVNAFLGEMQQKVWRKGNA